MSSQAATTSGTPSALINAFEALATRRPDISPFMEYDRERYAYYNNWTNLKLADGVLKRDNFDIPYKVRGTIEGRKNRQPTRLAIDLVGGPGTAMTNQWQTNSSPEQFRVATANWRGAGSSTPTGCLENNRTEKLVEDMEALRIAAGMGHDERVVIRGSSWGMTMATAYAAANPSKVAGLVLGLPFLARRADVGHNFGAEGLLAQRYPAEFDRYISATGKMNAQEGLQQLADELGSTDSKRVVAAFIAASRWEQARNGEIYTRTADSVNLDDPMDRQLIARARIMAQYGAENYYLGKMGVRAQLQAIGKSDIPVIVMAHSNDPLCEPETLNMVKEALPKAEIHVYDANWHRLGKDSERPGTGYDNSFTDGGYPYAMAKMGLVLRGDIDLTPGVQVHQRKNRLECV